MIIFSKLVRIVIKIYESFFKKVHLWGLPSLLLLSYLSAIGLQNITSPQVFSRITLSVFHQLNGLFLVSVCFTIVYDILIRYLAKKHYFFSFQQPLLMDTGQRSSSLFQRIIETLFFILLFLSCSTGILLYITSSIESTFVGITTIQIQLFHHIVGWFFAPIVSIKYYLVLSAWIRTLILSLREY